MKKLFPVLFLVLFKQGFSQDTIFTYDHLLNYKIHHSVEAFKEPSEVYADGQLIFVKDFSYDKPTKKLFMNAEYFRVSQDTFFVINYDSLQRVTSCGKVIAKNPLFGRNRTTYTEPDPPYYTMMIGLGFNTDYRIGQWQEMDISMDKIWVGDYADGKKIGEWILFRFFGDGIDRKAVYKIIQY